MPWHASMYSVDRWVRARARMRTSSKKFLAAAIELAIVVLMSPMPPWHARTSRTHTAMCTGVRTAA